MSGRYSRTPSSLWRSGLALAAFSVAACEPKPSPELLARIDSLNAVVAEKDQLVQDVAENARFLSEISAELAKVKVPANELKVSSESPLRASRDSAIGKIRYVTKQLNQVEVRLRESRQRLRSLTQLSDSLRATLEATIANYDAIVESQKEQIAVLAQEVNQLAVENVALKDTVSTMSERENTVYYVIGTKDELKERGIVVEEGGSRVLFLLWKRGKTVAPARDLDPGDFVAIDKREMTEIPLPEPESKYMIASRQDLDFLATPPNEDGKFTGIESIKIAEPERFWANSKFLIIVRQG